MKTKWNCSVWTELIKKVSRSINVVNLKNLQVFIIPVNFLEKELELEGLSLYLVVMWLKCSCCPHFLTVALQGKNIASSGETYKRFTKIVKGL